MHLPRIPELDLLAQKYSGGDTRQQRMIRLKIKEILAYYDECYGEEREFADEVTRRFCQLIALLSEQECARHETPSPFSAAFDGTRSRYVPLNAEVIPWDEEDEDLDWDQEEGEVLLSPFEGEEELLEAFYRHFEGTKSDLTLRDYCNRIRTFTKRYMMTIPQVRTLYDQQNYREAPAPILFLFHHLDYIIAHFDTNREDGTPDKQKLNLRSALRKLNKFKYEAGLQ